MTQGMNRGAAMAKTFTVWADGRLDLGDRRARCALGPGGIVAAAEKCEGDGKTPAGVWPLRALLYRADRLTRPRSGLETRPLHPDDGWCDAPNDPNYNRAVAWPYRASAERLWREDGIYDLIVPLGYNDEPVIAGAGSAIFLHLAREDYSPTRGCVALAKDDLLALLTQASPGDALRIALDRSPTSATVG